MPNEPDPPGGPPGGAPLPVEARRRGGMDTLFSAEWFDEDRETVPTSAPAARPKPAAAKGPPDAVVIAIAVLAGMGVAGFGCLSVTFTGLFAYLATLP